VANIKQENWRLETTNVFERPSEARGEARVEVESLPPVVETILGRAPRQLNETPLLEPELPPTGVEEKKEEVETLPELDEKTQRFVSLGLPEKRLSQEFPLCSRMGQELSFVVLREELARVLGGTLFALERAEAARGR
jgi:hypothetical protein